MYIWQWDQIRTHSQHTVCMLLCVRGIRLSLNTSRIPSLCGGEWSCICKRTYDVRNGLLEAKLCWLNNNPSQSPHMTHKKFVALLESAETCPRPQVSYFFNLFCCIWASVILGKDSWSWSLIPRLSDTGVVRLRLANLKTLSSNTVAISCSSPTLKRCCQILSLSLWLANLEALLSNTVAFVVARQPKDLSSNTGSFGCSSPTFRHCRQIPLLSLWPANPKTCHRTLLLLVVVTNLEALSSNTVAFVVARQPKDLSSNTASFGCSHQPWSIVVKYRCFRCGSPTQSLLVKHFFF